MKSLKVNLKQFFCLLTTILCCGSLLPPTQTTYPPGKDPVNPGQSQDAETLEYVEVVNVALVLRALKKGRPAAGLRQKDFTLYENGKPRPLTSFQEIRRKVGRNVEEKTTPPPAGKKRLFFLYFQVSEPDPKIPKTLDYFFHEVYRDGDYALLMMGNRVLPITRRSQVEPALTLFNNALTRLVNNTRLAKQKLNDYLEVSVRQFLEETRKNSGALLEQNVNLLISNFKYAWQEYKQNNIFLAGEKLQKIAESLKKVDLEKWGFVFYQQESFPYLNSRSIRELGGSPAAAVKIRQALEQLTPKMIPRQSLQTIKDFQQAFIEANATFHLLLSNPTSMVNMGTSYLEHKAAQTDWQEAFRGISQTSGGGIIQDNNWQRSLVQAVEREDVFYRLTYAPAAAGDERRKIRIRTKLPGIKLQHHRQVTVSPADKITIDQLSFNHPLLEFTLKNYRQFFNGSGLYGDIQVNITTVDANGSHRTLKKILEPFQYEMAVSMNLDFPSGGDYSLIIEAHDRQTGQTASVNQKITIPKNKYQLEPVLVTEAFEEMKTPGSQQVLDSLLKKSARYCEKLKKLTFYFFCTEEVIDSHWFGGNLLRKNRYFYDYQIIMEEGGTMYEDRSLQQVSMAPGKTNTGTGKINHREEIITNFFSSYPFLMPISMLAQENQPQYRYRLLDRKTDAGRILYKVRVEPKQEGIMIKECNYGVVWIDEKDGSIYKIQLDSNSLTGIKQIMAVARGKRRRLKVSDVHWYEVARNGIRFPSRTEINVYFLDWNLSKKRWDRLKTVAQEQMGTVFEYKKYQFFNVNVDIVETAHQ